MTFDPDKLRKELFGGSDEEESTPEPEKVSQPERTPEEPSRDDYFNHPSESEVDDPSPIRDISDEAPLSFVDDTQVSPDRDIEYKPEEDSVWKLPEPKPEYSPENLKKTPAKKEEPAPPEINKEPSTPLSDRIARTSTQQDSVINIPISQPEAEQTPEVVEEPDPVVETVAKVEEPVVEQPTQPVKEDPWKPIKEQKSEITSKVDIPKAEPPKERPVVLPPAKPETEPVREPVMANGADTSESTEPEPASTPEQVIINRPEPSVVEDRVPDELEKTNADEFAPLRKVLTDNESPEADEKPEPETPEPPKPDEKEIELNTGKGAKPKVQIAPEDIKQPSPISFLMLVGGGISLLIAMIALAIGNTASSVIALGGIGLGLVGAFALINRLWLRLSLSARSTKYGVNVTFVVLTFLAILVFANILSYRYHYRYDLSQQNLNSLSSQSIGVLEDINRVGEDITVTAFIPPSTDFRGPVENLMSLYQYHSPHIKFSFVDPEVQRALTEEKGITTSMALLFELGENRSVQTDFDEPHITSGLIGVRQSYTKKIAFITGHGEVDPFNDNDIGGLSKFRERLELEGYAVESLSIAPSTGIPAETSLVVIVGPERPYRSSEIFAIEEYLSAGGDLMAFLEPDDQSGLHEVFARYGIIVEEGVLLDDFENYNGEVKTPEIFVKTMDHPVTKVILDNLVFNVAGTLSENTSGYDDIVTEVLLTSGASAWIENSGDLTYTDEVERRGQKYVAILATRRVEKNPGSQPAPVEDNVVDSENPDSVNEITEPAEPVLDPVMDEFTPSQILVVSDASMILNGTGETGYNFDFTLNAVNHMTDAENLIGIRPARDIDRTLDLSSAQTNTIFGVSIILTPLLIALMGGFVWMKRRS